jgi:acetylornithine/N-succinyldiaminopimelate aminotransferase
VQAKLRAKKVLVGVAGENVVRFAPPLIVDAAQISHFVDAIDSVLSEVEAGA